MSALWWFQHCKLASSKLWKMFFFQDTESELSTLHSGVSDMVWTGETITRRADEPGQEGIHLITHFHWSHSINITWVGSEALLLWSMLLQEIICQSPFRCFQVNWTDGNHIFGVVILPLIKALNSCLWLSHYTRCTMIHLSTTSQNKWLKGVISRVSPWWLTFNQLKYHEDHELFWIKWWCIANPKGFLL